MQVEVDTSTVGLIPPNSLIAWMNQNAHVCYLGKLLAACFVLCLNGLFVLIGLDIPTVS